MGGLNWKNFGDALFPGATNGVKKGLAGAFWKTPVEGKFVQIKTFFFALGDGIGGGGFFGCGEKPQTSPQKILVWKLDPPGFF